MGEDSSDEIVLVRRQDTCEDSSDVVVLTPVEDSWTQGKNIDKNTTGGTKQKCRSTGESCPKRPRRRCNDEGLCVVKVVCGETEEVRYLKRTDTLESIHQEFCGEDPKIKMRYKSTFVSKYLTLEEVGFGDEDSIMIHKPQATANCSDFVKVKINVDVDRTVEFQLDGDSAVERVLDKARENGHRGDILVKNGHVVSLARRIRDVLGSGDVIDLISYDDICCDVTKPL